MSKLEKVLLSCFAVASGLYVCAEGQTEAPQNQSNQPSNQSNQPSNQSNQSNQPSNQSNQPSNQSNQPSNQSNPPSNQSNPPSSQSNQPVDQSNQPGNQNNQPVDYFIQKDRPPLGRMAVAAQKALPSVVSIYVTYNDVGSEHPFLEMLRRFVAIPRSTAGRGSGVLVSPKHVVTCAHVVNGAKQVEVVTGARKVKAQVAFLDKSLDLAVLMLDVPRSEAPLPYIHIAEYPLQVGEELLVIGNPFGIGVSVTQGILSAGCRAIGEHVVYQTDASINPGNSGGAVIDANGRLVGLPNAILSETGASHGVGFFLPVRSIVYALNRVIHGAKKARTPLVVTAVDPSLQNYLRTGGCEVVFVLDKSLPLSKGDIIISVDGNPVSLEQEFNYRCSTMSVGTKYPIGYMKSGELVNGSPRIYEVWVTAQEQDDPGIKILEGKHPLNGLGVAQLTPDIAGTLGVDPTKTGVIVMSVLPPLEAQLGLAEGDIILVVDNTAITDVSALVEVVKAGQNNRSISLVTERKGQVRTYQIY